MKKRTNSCAPLMDFVNAIVANDLPQFGKSLANNLALARQPLPTGATRSRAKDFFFPQIKHYLFAGDTPLHAAAAAHRQEMIKVLLERGADVAATNRRGATPLHYAADGAPDLPAWDPQAQAATISLLIDAGAKPDVFDNGGVAPLHRAVRDRSAAAVECLLRKGAAVSIRNKNGSTPLHLAVQTTGKSGSGLPAAKELQKEIIKLLLRAGADPNDRDDRGKSVVESATGEGQSFIQLMAENA